MKLVHPEYSFQINFEEGIVQRMIIESPSVMSEFIIDFKKQSDGEEGRWVLSVDGEILKFQDHCELVLNIFDLKMNQRKMINTLYEQLAFEINSTELLADWREMNSRMENILNNAIENVGYDVIYEDLELKALFKALDLKFQEREAGYVECLLDYLQLLSDVRKIKVFIFVNITSFLEAKEIQYLYEEASYKKYYLLLLDGRDLCIDRETERKIIIDEDYCVIDTSMQ